MQEAHYGDALGYVLNFIIESGARDLCNSLTGLSGGHSGVGKVQLVYLSVEIGVGVRIWDW